MSPITIIVAAVIVGFLAVGISALVIQRRRRNYATVFYFDRQGHVLMTRGESFAGLVSFPDGGFMERSEAKINMRYGSPFLEKGPMSWRRPRKPVFLLRAGDSSPIEFDPDGSLHVNNVSDAEYGERLNLASELAVAESASKAGGTDMVNLALGGTLILLSLGTAGIAAAVAVKGTL